MAERRAGVLGHPIAHSLSPTLHRAAYAELGLDWEYGAYDVDSGGLADFIGGLDDAWAGLSLTMPLKRAVLPLLDEASDRVRATGAANKAPATAAAPNARRVQFIMDNSYPLFCEHHGNRCCRKCVGS